MQRGRPRRESAGSMGHLGLASCSSQVAVETACVYGDSIAAPITQIYRRITDATRESGDPLDDIRACFNCAAILTAIREKHDGELGVS